MGTKGSSSLVWRVDAWRGYLVGGDELRAEQGWVSGYVMSCMSPGKPTTWSGWSPNKDRKGLGGLEREKVKSDTGLGKYR